jgi:hypothetical protein
MIFLVIGCPVLLSFLITDLFFSASHLTPHALRYRITLSALAKTFGGIVNPICLAAFRLMMNSNFVACCTLSEGPALAAAPRRTSKAQRAWRSPPKQILDF